MFASLWDESFGLSSCYDFLLTPPLYLSTDHHPSNTPYFFSLKNNKNEKNPQTTTLPTLHIILDVCVYM